MERPDRYDPHAIERRWQAVWDDEGTWQVPNPGEPGFDPEARKSYVLEMLPYPSGEPHMGHLKNYTMGDVLAHYRRRNGMQVLHPMGYDAFGLPAENHAIKTGEHPAQSTNASIEEFRRQFRSWGISIDWRREFGTHEPALLPLDAVDLPQALRAGLAYRKQAPVKWCPKDQTVLANEQVIDGACERCGTPVVVKQLEQWFLKITDYADRLLEDFELLESWPERVITMQRNWIGRSEGAEVIFRCDEPAIEFPVFTTRPDTLFGATFFVLAPEHPDLERLVAGQRPRAGGRRVRAARAQGIDRGARGHRAREDRRLHRPPRRQPGQRREHSRLRLRLRADGVRDRRRSWRCRRTTSATSSSRASSGSRSGAWSSRSTARRSEDEAFVAHAGQERLVNSGQFDGMTAPEAIKAITRVAGGARTGPAGGQLPAARLARLTAALLGRADTDRLLRAVRHGAGARGPAAGAAAGDRGLRAQGQAAAGGERGVRQHDLPAAAAGPRAARRTRWTPSSTPPGTSCATATRATTRRRGTARRRPLDARRPVHRRRRARDPAPDVRALLHQGAGGHGPALVPGAVREPVHAGHDHLPGREDVEVEGQRDQPLGLRRALRRRHRALLHPLPRPAGPGRRLVRRGRRRSAPLPRSRLATGGGGRRARAGGRGAEPPDAVAASGRRRWSWRARRTGRSRR